MKALLLAASLTIGYVVSLPSCEECNQAAAGLLTRLTSAESIEEQKLFIIENLCPGAASLVDCKAFFDSWGDIANCLYPAFIGASDTCERLGLCKVKSVLGDWTAIMTRVADFMKEADTIAQGVAILQGECFCGAAGHTADCPDLVAGLAEPA